MMMKKKCLYAVEFGCRWTDRPTLHRFIERGELHGAV